ncbi:MAG: acyl transferase [Bacteroidota bacterium]|nr:acyl transferase [Bacteroidota bacterium]
MDGIENKIFNIRNDHEFTSLALDIFRFQATLNPVYRRFLAHLNTNVSQVSALSEIPCMPVDMFKTHEVKTGIFTPEITFISSGTAGSERSAHHVKSTDLYRESVTKGFELFYGNPSRYAVFALLPSYLERENASLVYMAKTLMEFNPDNCGGFYLKHNDKLNKAIKKAEAKGYQPLLLGVSFALLEMATHINIDLTNTIIIETGGMKGMRKEMIRDELHGYLENKLHPKAIHSEYGMTEMLTQAYKKDNSQFLTPPWLKICIRDMHDPFFYLPAGQKGLINVIDLANVHSCAFLQTSDVGKITPDGFTISGRMDFSDIRGCNLMV